jgi:hypothetical protein
VTFSTAEQAHKSDLLFISEYNEVYLSRIRSDFRTTCFSKDRRPETSTSKTLGLHEWTVKFAPSPKNIIW